MSRPANDRLGANWVVPGAGVERRVSYSKSGRSRRWGLLRQALSNVRTKKEFLVQIRGAAGTNPWLHLGSRLHLRPFFILVSVRVDKRGRFFIFSPDEMTLELGQAKMTHTPNDTTDGFGIDRALPYENRWGTLPLP